jgi:hypothetical protein
MRIIAEFSFSKDGNPRKLDEFDFYRDNPPLCSKERVAQDLLS